MMPTGEEKGEEEQVLLTKFKGKCNFCGNIGHKATQCPKKKQQDKSNKKQKCTHCRKLDTPSIISGYRKENKKKAQQDSNEQVDMVLIVIKKRL